jgi:hypothetical protein
LLSADGALTGTAGECAIVGEGKNDLQVAGSAHCATVLIAPTVALTPVMSEVDCLWTRVRIVGRGKESDRVASAGKLFDIVPYKMKKVYIRFRVARDRIDSYNVKASTEFTV